MEEEDSYTPTDNEWELKKTGNCYRGTIIADSANLEKLMEMYIAHYFTPEGKIASEMGSLVLDRLTFDSKIAIIETMLKLKVGDNFKKKYSKLISELRYIKDERNKFAHYTQLIIGQEIVVLENWRNDHAFFEYPKDKLDNITSRINRCVNEIFEMIKNIWDYDESGSPYKL